MKIVALGDTHGRVVWKRIVANEEATADKIIFMGDYFDTHGGKVSPNKQLANFKDILAYKRANPDKVIMLTGNHDYHYIKGISENYSGYQGGYAIDFGEALEDAFKDASMQMCYIHDKFVFTHAGITKTWAKNNEIDTTNLEQSVNDMFKFKPRRFGFIMGDNFDQTGDDITQPPIWVRPRSLYKDKLDGIINIVGHTTVTKLDVSKAEDFNMIMIDCLGTSIEYLVIEDGIARAAKFRYDK